MRHLTLCILLICCPLLAVAAERDDLLARLDQTIEMRPTIMQRKQRAIDQLRQELHAAGTTDADRMRLHEALWQEYSAYNTDSASYYANQMYQLAERTADRPHQIWATLHKAEALMTAGMFKEAFDLLSPIRSQAGDPTYATVYYHLCRTLYGYMTDYAVTPEERTAYARRTKLYRDSVLARYARGTGMWRMIRADGLTSDGRPREAIRTLLPYKPSADHHFDAAYTYTLAEAYMRMGDRERAFGYYALSATDDMMNETREYISLRKLAMLLYEQGDVDRAYRYLSICMDDAKACNARLRILEILDSFPVINGAYLAKKHQQQMRLVWALVAISLLAVLLMLAYRYVLTQKHALVRTRQSLSRANTELKGMNRQLVESNILMEHQKQQIEETSYIKEIYIGRYMDQCSNYLEKLDRLRRNLRKLVEHGGQQELKSFFSSSSKEMDEELSEFYDNFDDTFLELFPTFVADINALLQPEGQIVPKPGHKLNTELRIFALIRLGITDSVKIAQFLRYSTTTIYNYRTRVRNRALGDRDQLEKQVAMIGRADG